LGKRSRQREAAATPRLRGEAANEAARAELEPLKPGERPPALIAAVIVAAALGIANVALYAAGAIAFAVLMGAAAWGMWNLRYWAVLGFQALLAVTIIIAALSLAVASNLTAVALCLVIVVPGGWLFWKLVRVLARLQMPERR
jgi:amino acid transporter